VTNTVHVMTTVDTEEEWDWSGPHPRQGAAVSNIAHLDRFQSLCERYGMAATYFTNHAVMSDPRACATMQDLSRRPGVEIGMHIHPWNTPPLSPQGKVSARETFLHNEPPAVVAAKLDATYLAFEQAGLQPTSFRGGRYSSGGEIHAFLKRRGFVADCSVVPYTSWPDDGAPDFRDRGPMPVRIAPAEAGQRALWEIPLSMGFTRTPFELWAKVFQAVEGSALRRLRLIGIAERIGLVRRVWLNFEIGDSHDWTPFMLLLQRLGVPCITFTVHSSSLVAGPGPYTRNADDERRIYDQIESTFASVTRLPGFVPASASAVAGFLEKKHAGLGN
jgi:hypothetical protein